MRTNPVHLLQAAVVDAVKRRAIRALSATRRGEALLLHTYLWAEEGAEGAVLGEALAGDPPRWLARHVARHAGEEQRHARLLRARLAELGVAARAPRVDPISRRKLARLRRIVLAHARRFRAGRVVPTFAVALRMEAMGVRVLERHVRVLAPPHPTRALLEEIVADERHHVRSCESVLARLVAPDERAALAEVLRRVDAVERAFAVTGALGLLAAGWALRVAS
jgi:hypothetical protein